MKRWAAAVGLALAMGAAQAAFYDDMRARFPVYLPICGGQVACVLERMQSWFGRTFEAFDYNGATYVYLVQRDANRAIVVLEPVGRMP